MTLFRILFLSVLCLCCKTRSKTDYSWAFVELNPPPGISPLWSECTEIPTSKQGDETIYNIAGHQYKLGKKLGEGGDGKVYKLIGLDSQSPRLVIKIAHIKDSKWAYTDLLLHSTLEILGVPTVKAGLGYLNEGGDRKYVVVKELVAGKNFGDYLISLSINSMNFFNQEVSAESTAKLKLASRIFSRVINSGVFIDDMHSRNLMWDEKKEMYLMIDGTITKASLKGPINPRKDFGRAIGMPQVGDRLFYERYYDHDERPSEEAIESAHKRIAAFFAQGDQFQKDCAKGSGSETAVEIDVHKVVGALK